MTMNQLDHWIADGSWLVTKETDIATTLPPYSPWAHHRTLRATDQQLWLGHLKTVIQKDDAHIKNSLPPKRLGAQFENLVAMYLEYWFGQGNVMRNLQIQTSEENGTRRTLGELDFIIDTQNGPFHLETAVKFYLGIQTAKEDYQWLGPNCQDTFQKKSIHLQNHQLPMGKQWQPNIRSFYWLKGYLFRHISELPNDNKNRWIYIHELNEYAKYFPSEWAVLEKHQWLGGCYRQEQICQNVAKLENTVAQQLQETNAIMIIPHQNGQGDQWRQNSQRLMVVASSWPATKS